MRVLIPIIAACLFSFSALPAVAAEQKGKSEKPCEALALLFGEPVCRGDFQEQTSKFLDATHVPQEKRPELLEQMRNHNRKQMLDILWNRALAKKFGSDAMTPADEEVTRFAEGFRKTLETSYDADKKLVAWLRETLAKNSFEDSARTHIEDIIGAAETGIKFYEERKKQIAALPKEYVFITESAEKEIARGMVARWKADKVLYDTYGGRLAMGTGGPLPVDAYRKFLEYIDADGGFKANDPAYQDIFADVRALGGGAETLPPDSDVYKNYFADPTWQFTLSNSDRRLEDLRKWIDTLPRKKK